MCEEGDAADSFANRKAIRVLIAEDNPADVELVRYALQATGQNLNFVVAKDGAVALEFLFDKTGNQPPLDFLLLDINLPKYDGFEILCKMRQDAQVARLPVIVLSTSPTDIIEEGLDRVSARVAGFYSKPADLDEYMQLGYSILDCFFKAVSDEPPGCQPSR